MKRIIYSLSLLVLLGTSCRNIQKMVDRGEYDEAIVYAAQKLAGKKNKKTKYVQSLEEAFQKVTRMDMERIEFLQDERKPENWDKIIAVYEKIDRRQSRVSPFLPLISKDGYRANFKFVNVSPLIKTAMNEAAGYHYDKANVHLAAARRGSKNDAKIAYDEIRRIERYFKNHKDSENIKREALDLGQTRVLVSVENKSAAIIPSGFEREIIAMDLANLNTQWKSFYMSAPGNKKIDYRAVLKINRLDLTPERETINHYIDEKEIKDGYRYVLDQNGNVLKDTLGNDIKEPRMVIVRADVVEIFREKAALVSGNLECFDKYTNELVKVLPITVNSSFRDYASSYRGDRRAICDRTRNRLKTAPAPFPSDTEMIWESADELKTVFKSSLRKLNI